MKLLPIEYFKSEEVLKILRGVESMLNNSTNELTMNVFINIVGYVVMLEVPYYEDNNIIMSKWSENDSSPETAGITCSRNNAESSCPKDGNSTAKWCDAENCKSCTMSELVVDGEGNEKFLTAINGFVFIEYSQYTCITNNKSIVRICRN